MDWGCGLTRFGGGKVSLSVLHGGLGLLEDSVHGVFQFFKVHGFGEEFFGPGDLRRVARHVRTHGADHDDGDVERGRVAGKNFADAQAVEVRQQEVQKDEIGRVFPCGVEGVGAVGGGAKTVVAVGQAVLHQLRKIELVVHDQDVFFHALK